MSQTLQADSAVSADAGVSTASTPVRMPKAAVAIAQTLRRLIVDGQLKEGGFLPNEAQLMDQYQVSRPRATFTNWN